MAERQAATGQRRTDLQLEAELERPRDGHGRPASRPHPSGDLTVCPCCAKDFVYPVDWAPAGEQRWSVALRCPDCEWRGAGTYGQDLVDRFDEALDESMQTILDDLELLARANMEEQVDAFVDALQRDLILPEDF